MPRLEDRFELVMFEDELKEEEEVEEKDCFFTEDETLDDCCTDEDDSLTDEDDSLTDEDAWLEDADCCTDDDCSTEDDDLLTVPSAAGTTSAPSCGEAR